MNTDARSAVGGRLAEHWVKVAGLVAGAMTLLYLMAVALVLVLLDVGCSEDAKVVLSAVLAFGLALASGFIGGHAAATGTIPWLARHPVRFSTGGGIAVFFIVFFAVVGAWRDEEDTTRAGSRSKDDRTLAEAAVIDLKARIVGLRGDYELAGGDSGEVPPGSEGIRARVREDSERFADRMLVLGEASMNYGHIIAKWEYASYALGLAASLEDSPVDRLRLAARTQATAEYGLRLVSRVRRRASNGDRYYTRLLDFLTAQQTEGRLLYLVALSLAIELQTPGGSVSAEEASQAIRRIPPRFQEDSKPEWNKWFRGVAETTSKESAMR